jgi:Tfp pilus assembly protein PilW
LPHVTRLPIAALMAVALACAACGNTISPAPSLSPAPTAAAPASAPASAAPTAAAARHADPALEALLPKTLGGVSLVSESQLGTDLTGKSDALDAMLANLGKTIADFTVASAYSPAGDVKAQVGAWRIAGATAEKLLPAFVAVVQTSSATKLTVSEITLGGHAVTQIGVAGELAQGPLYAYAKDDVMLFVQTPDPKLAEEALAKMP